MFKERELEGLVYFQLANEFHCVCKEILYQLWDCYLICKIEQCFPAACFLED